MGQITLTSPSVSTSSSLGIHKLLQQESRCTINHPGSFRVGEPNRDSESGSRAGEPWKILHAWPCISLHGADLQHAEALTFSQNNFFPEQAWPPSLRLSAGPTAERMRRDAAEPPVARPSPKRGMQFSVTASEGRRGRDAPAQCAKAALCSACQFSASWPGASCAFCGSTERASAPGAA